MKYKRLLLSAIAVLLGGLVLTFFQEKNLVLFAKDSVPIYATIEDATAGNGVVISEMIAGQHVPLLECIDVKHYLIYKIRMPDGRIGFVNEGSYLLLRYDKPSHC